MKRVALTVLVLAAFAVAASDILAQPGRRSDRRPTGRINPLMRLFDADRNGTLSADEIAGTAAKLKELDMNKDGELNDEELGGALPSGRGSGGRAGGGPAAGRGGPVGRGGPGRVSESDLQKETLAQDDSEKRILATLDEMLQGERFRNVSQTDGRLLRLLAETMGAKRVVEIGTSTGESAVWLALAVQSTGGHIYTHEIDEGRAKIAQENFKKAGVEKIVTLIQGDAHEAVKRYKDPNDSLFVDAGKGQSIDILFLDADKEGYIDYLDQLMPLIRPGGLVIAHNMNTRQADARFVKAITENPALETLILLKEGTGVGVTLKKR